MSQTALADVFGIKRATIGAYEEERAEPKAELMVQIARYFGVSVENLICLNMQENGMPKPKMEIDIDIPCPKESLSTIKFGENTLIVRPIENPDSIEQLPQGKVLANYGGEYGMLQKNNGQTPLQTFEIMYVAKPYRSADFAEIMLFEISQKLDKIAR